MLKKYLRQIFPLQTILLYDITPKIIPNLLATISYVNIYMAVLQEPQYLTQKMPL